MLIVLSKFLLAFEMLEFFFVEEEYFFPISGKLIL